MSAYCFTPAVDSGGYGSRFNPFPGLRPFREDEEHLFFGREHQVDGMVDKLARRFLAVVGTSGCGKSSLVNCGLRPALHRGLMASGGSSWRMAKFTPGGDPLRSLAGALAKPGVLVDEYDAPVPFAEIVETWLRVSSCGLIETFRKARLPERTNLLIIADQFEELFRYRGVQSNGTDEVRPSADSTALVNLLLEARASNTRIYVVLTMRSDFLGDCAQFYGLPEAINEGQYLVPRLSRDERRATIEGPVAVAGADISPVLLTRLVNDVGDNPDQLSILQHSLNRTWARWQNEGGGCGPIAMAHYESIGGMAQALDLHAEKAFAELGGGRLRTVCEKVFKTLTDKGTDVRGIRRPTRMDRLCDIAGASAEEVTTVINVFRKPSRSFLMPPRAEELKADTVIDISHESLMRVWRRLRMWADEEAQSAQMYRRIADTARLAAADKAGLWRDPDLQVALEWRAREQPTAAWADLYGGGFRDAEAFLARSRDVRDREAGELEVERRWKGVWAPTVAFATMVLFVVGLPFVAKPAARPLAEALISLIPRLNVDQGRPLELLLSVILIGSPSMLVYLAGNHYGRRAFRRFAWDRVMRSVRRASEPEVSTVPPASVIAEAVAATAPQAAEQPLPAYASFGARMLAFAIDSLVVLVLIVVPSLMIAAAEQSYPSGTFGYDAWMSFALFFWYASSCAYHSLMIASRWQATLGMLAARVFVTDVAGHKLTFSRSLVRQMAGLLSFYSLPIGFLIQPLTPRKQALHDLIAKSLVVRGSARRFHAGGCGVGRPKTKEWLMAGGPAFVFIIILVGMVFVPVTDPEATNAYMLLPPTPEHPASVRFGNDVTKYSDYGRYAAAKTGITTPSDADQHSPADPLTGLSPEQAARYCEWHAGRLPTVDEVMHAIAAGVKLAPDLWEYATRGGAADAVAVRLVGARLETASLSQVNAGKIATRCAANPQ